MYRGRGDSRGRGGNPRGSMGGNSRGGRGRGGSPFSSWQPSAYDSRPDTGSSLDWANSEARAKMLGGRDTTDRGGGDYYDVYGRESAPGVADYHSSFVPPDYVTYPVPVKAPQTNRPLFDSPKPKGGAPQFGKRPPAPALQQSPPTQAGAKRVKLSSMNELLESSQRDMSAMDISQGNSELSKVLEKQQRLLEMQSKLIAEMAGGTNGTNGVPKPVESIKQEREVPAAASARGAHSRGGALLQRGGSAPRRGEGQRGRPAARRGGHKSLWETLESDKPEDSFGLSAVGRGARGRGDAGLRGRGLGARARGRGEGSLARGRGDGLLARGRGALARGRGAAPYGRGRGMEDMDYEEEYAESDPYSYGETQGRGAFRGARGMAARGRGGVPRGRGARADPYADPYAQDPYAADPYAADPYAEDPYAADPYAEDPYARDPYTRDPYARDPYARDPYARDPYARDRYAADPYARDPYREDPYAVDPYAADPYGEDPYAADPYARDPYGEDPYAADPYAAAPSRAGARGRGASLAAQRQRRDPNLPLYDGQSVESRMHLFVGYLFQFRKLFLPISAIETTRHEHVADVKVRTQFITYEDERKTPSTFGLLRINGLILAIEQGDGLTELKDNTYKKALYNLFTMSISEMFSHSFKLRRRIPMKVQDEENLKTGPNKIIGNRLQCIVDMMRQELFDNQEQGVNARLNYEIDVASGNAQAGITLVYRKSFDNKNIFCDLYLDDLNLASASSNSKSSANHFAYKDTKNYLLNFAKPSMDIVRENRRLQEVDIMADDVIDIQYKGKNHERGTNLGILKSKFPKTWKQDIAERRNMMVVMHSHDRAAIPYKVLEDLANMNHMLIQFANFSEGEGTPYRCVIFLQGELVGDGEGYKRNEAKDNAARKALSTLSENNSVIQVGKRKYNNPDYNFAAVKEAAEKLKSENPTMFQDWKSAVHPQPKGDDPPIDELTPYVDKILEDLIQDYIATQGMEEIILERDFPSFYITMMLQMCKDLDVDIEKKDGDSHQDRTGRTVIQKSVFKTGYPSEIVKILREANNQSGRYTLNQWVDENGQLVKKRG